MLAEATWRCPERLVRYTVIRAAAGTIGGAGLRGGATLQRDQCRRDVAECCGGCSGVLPPVSTALRVLLEKEAMKNEECVLRALGPLGTLGGCFGCRGRSPPLSPRPCPTILMCDRLRGTIPKAYRTQEVKGGSE
ncbi:hypothetical protein NDU88_005474 [Pleurodeles waltl]|uniref:Uncharacterized protein n=1 Tax=Pleurodeles waltl TaxID=8319 RepID=A0AAV7WXZ6_PLEWA|nr:hypothetical protein NDU88_005474 [Pleurodeles waltl]